MKDGETSFCKQKVVFAGSVADGHIELKVTLEWKKTKERERRNVKRSQQAGLLLLGPAGKRNSVITSPTSSLGTSPVQ